jgi:hypothetical protein
VVRQSAYIACVYHQEPIQCGERRLKQLQAAQEVPERILLKDRRVCRHTDDSHCPPNGYHETLECFRVVCHVIIPINHGCCLQAYSAPEIHDYHCCVQDATVLGAAGMSSIASTYKVEIKARNPAVEEQLPHWSLLQRSENGAHPSTAPSQASRPKRRHFALL